MKRYHEETWDAGKGGGVDYGWGPAKMAKGAPKGKGGSAISIPTRLGCQAFFKFLVEPHMATTLIGPGGKTIEKVQQELMCAVKVSKKEHGFFPGTNSQLVLLGAVDVPKLHGVIDMIMNTIAEHFTGPDCAINIIVPTYCASKIIGRAGENQKRLNELGVKVLIDKIQHKEGDIHEQQCRCQGNFENIRKAITIITDQVNESAKDESWFLTWGCNMTNMGLMAHLAGADPWDMGMGGKGMGKGMGKGDDWSMMNGGSPGGMGPPMGMGPPGAMGPPMMGGKGGGVPPAPGADPAISALNDLVLRLRRDVPATLSQDMAFEVTLSSSQIHTLISGDAVNRIQQQTAAQFSVGGTQGDDTRSLTITGKPGAIYAAHLMAMSVIVEASLAAASPRW